MIVFFTSPEIHTVQSSEAHTKSHLPKHWKGLVMYKEDREKCPPAEDFELNIYCMVV